MCRFLGKYADGEIITLLEECVPPADPNRVSIFRLPMSKHALKAGCTQAFSFPRAVPG